VCEGDRQTAGHWIGGATSSHKPSDSKSDTPQYTKQRNIQFNHIKHIIPFPYLIERIRRAVLYYS
jgi:hypothetical protein